MFRKILVTLKKCLILVTIEWKSKCCDDSKKLVARKMKYETRSSAIK